MEAATRRRLWQKAKSIYYSLRSLLCFFVSVGTDDVEPHSSTARSDHDGGPSGTATRSEKDGGETTHELAAIPCHFQFEALPEVCQLHVFSYLTAQERGRASSVCRRWNVLIQSATLWTDVDLTSFSLCCRCSDRPNNDPCSSIFCYEMYKERVQLYVEHLERIRPNVRRFRFAFDIGDYTDDWLDTVSGLLRSLRCSELAVAHLNWKETPAKSTKIIERTLLSLSATTFNDFTSYHRRRQRLFANFFDLFVALAANVVELSMPFDWSPRSLQALGRLRRLAVLKLDVYFVPQPVTQSTIDELLHSVPQLRCLSLAVCVSSGAGLVPFRLHSRSLRHLDIAQCSGFCLGQVDLPRLTSLVAAVQPSHGPLGSVAAHRTCVSTIPCMYDVLKNGAPRLQCLNGHALHMGWREVYTDDLHSVLKDICACLAHSCST